MEQPDPKHYNDFLQSAIQLLDTLVLSIELPPAIVAAINRQTEQYYQIQEYKFRVEREAQESRRKQIEANGIAAFQRTVSQGISDSYLRWRGIEATLALAQSPNAKIVIFGTGKDGLPIILGNVDTPSGFGVTPAPPANGAAPPSGAPPAPSDKSSSGAPAPGGGSTETDKVGQSTGNTQSAFDAAPPGACSKSERYVRLRGHSVPALQPVPRAGFRVRRRTRERRRNSNLRFRLYDRAEVTSCRGHNEHPTI